MKKNKIFKEDMDGTDMGKNYTNKGQGQNDNVKNDVSRLMVKLDNPTISAYFDRIDNPVEQAQAIVQFANKIGIPKNKISTIVSDLKDDANESVTKKSLIESFKIKKNNLFKEDDIDLDIILARSMDKRLNEYRINLLRDYDCDDNEEIIKQTMESYEDVKTFDHKNKELILGMVETYLDENFGVCENLDFEYELVEDINEELSEVEEVKYKSLDEYKDINKHINKRIILGSIIDECANYFTCKFNGYNENILNEDPKLPIKYNKLVNGSNYLSLGDLENDNFKTSTHNLDISGDKPLVMVKATMFPSMLKETIKGMFNTILLHGLPKNKQVQEYILNKVEEHKNSIYGYTLWDRLKNKVKNNKDLPKLFYQMNKMGNDEFKTLTNELFLNTKKSNKIIEYLMK